MSNWKGIIFSNWLKVVTFLIISYVILGTLYMSSGYSISSGASIDIAKATNHVCGSSFDTSCNATSHETDMSVKHRPHEAYDIDVLYIWCGQKTFTFVHYLSLKSTTVNMKVNTITFLYEHLPVTHKYYIWFQDLENEFMFIKNIKR